MWEPGLWDSRVGMIANIQIRDLHERASGDPSHLHLNQVTAGLKPPTLEPLPEMVTYYLAFFSSVAGSLPEASLSLILPAGPCSKEGVTLILNSAPCSGIIDSEMNRKRTLKETGKIKNWTWWGLCKKPTGLPWVGKSQDNGSEAEAEKRLKAPV